VIIVPGCLLEDVLSHSAVADGAEREMRAAIESGEDRESVNKRIDRWPNIVK
jgi:hypothetical protein